MKKLLITRPEHDLPNKYLSLWNKDLIELGRKKNFQVKDLKGKLAQKEKFEKYMEKQKPNLVLLNGHGNSKVVFGQDNEPILIEGKNDDLLQGSIIHVLACDSAQSLAKSAVRKGAKAYIGYNMPFMFITDKYNECRPGQDKLAEIFKEPALEAPKNLINGKKATEAYEKAKEKYRETILSFSVSNVLNEAEYIRFALFSNMYSLSLCVEE